MTAHDQRFGSGWISGMLSAALGLMSLGAVLCLLFPEILTSPHLRQVYPMGLIRGLIRGSIVTAFMLGSLSMALRPNKWLGATGALSSTLATILGGAEVPVDRPVQSARYIGLDWFLLDLFLLALVFIPLERIYARLREQSILRPGWQTDLAHFFVSHILVQVLILATLMPATLFFRWALDSPLQRAVAAQPGWVQFLEMVLLADLGEYWSHRAFHAVPFLWRFHAIHHSAEYMDWLAGSRLHLVDIVVTRAFVFIPLYALGFSAGPLSAYLVFVSFHAVFIHANVRFGFGRWERVFGTPRFHHWHHAEDRNAVDKNFAVHLPLLDRAFGTFYLPGNQWPERYGIAGNPVPAGYLGQATWPFRRTGHVSG